MLSQGAKRGYAGSHGGEGQLKSSTMRLSRHCAVVMQVGLWARGVSAAIVQSAARLRGACRKGGSCSCEQLKACQIKNAEAGSSAKATAAGGLIWEEWRWGKKRNFCSGRKCARFCAGHCASLCKPRCLLGTGEEHSAVFTAPRCCGLLRVPWWYRCANTRLAALFGIVLAALHLRPARKSFKRRESGWNSCTLRRYPGTLAN